MSDASNAAGFNISPHPESIRSRARGPLRSATFSASCSRVIGRAVSERWIASRIARNSGALKPIIRSHAPFHQRS